MRLCAGTVLFCGAKTRSCGLSAPVANAIGAEKIWPKQGLGWADHKRIRPANWVGECFEFLNRHLENSVQIVYEDSWENDSQYDCAYWPVQALALVYQ